jgi:hypothetical protein
VTSAATTRQRHPAGSAAPRVQQVVALCVEQPQSSRGSLPAPVATSLESRSFCSHDGGDCCGQKIALLAIILYII